MRVKSHLPMKEYTAAASLINTAARLEPGQQPSTLQHLQHHSVHASSTMQAMLIAQHHANAEVPSTACTTELCCSCSCHTKPLLSMPHMTGHCRHTTGCCTWLAVSQHLPMVHLRAARICASAGAHRAGQGAACSGSCWCAWSCTSMLLLLCCEAVCCWRMVKLSKRRWVKLLSCCSRGLLLSCCCIAAAAASPLLTQQQAAHRAGKHRF
jgi:hypothetical protein